MPGIDITLLANKQNEQLNTDDYKVIAGEHNATKITVHFPIDYLDYSKRVDFLNVKKEGWTIGLYIPEDVNADYPAGFDKTNFEFTLPREVTVDGEIKMQFVAYLPDGSETFVPFEIVKLSVEEGLVYLKKKSFNPPDLLLQCYTTAVEALLISKQTRNTVNEIQYLVGEAQQSALDAEQSALRAQEIADDALTTCEECVASSEEAIAIATEAKGTADGLADSIATANETADQAEQHAITAEGNSLVAQQVATNAKNIAEGLNTQIVTANETATDALETANSAVDIAEEAKNIAENKLADGADSSSLTTTFFEDAGTDNIRSGETHSTLFGKIQKWFARLKALAFKNKIGTADITDNTVTNDKIVSIDGNKVSSQVESSRVADDYSEDGTIKSLIDTKLNIHQGFEYFGQYLIINGDGNVAMQVLPTIIEEAEVAENYSENGGIAQTFNTKLDKSQGSENAGKYLVVSSLGYVESVSLSTTIAHADEADNYSQSGSIASKFDTKLDKNQGSINQGKYLTVSSSGAIVLTAFPTHIESATIASNYNSDGTIATKFATKLDIAQGQNNNGKYLVVGSDGNISLITLPTTIAHANEADNYSNNGTIANTLSTKLDKNQGSANSGKILSINSTGNICLIDAPTHSDTAESAEIASNYATGGTIDLGLQRKLDKDQGITNGGKLLSVGANGNITLIHAPTHSLTSDEAVHSISADMADEANHASLADRSTNSTHTDESDHAEEADHAILADSATNATNSINATNSTNAINSQNAVNSTNAVNAEIADNYKVNGGIDNALNTKYDRFQGLEHAGTYLTVNSEGYVDFIYPPSTIDRALIAVDYEENGGIDLALQTKLDVDQGINNANKMLVVNASGNLVLVNQPTHIESADHSTTSDSSTTATEFTASGGIATKFNTKVDKVQGTSNNGKYLYVNSSGNVALLTPPTRIANANTADNYSETGTIATEFDRKFDKDQGTSYSGKYVSVLETGKLGLVDLPTIIAHAVVAEGYTLNGDIANTFATKLDKAQGQTNSGKYLVVGTDGYITLITRPTTIYHADTADDYGTSGTIASKFNTKLDIQQTTSLSGKYLTVSSTGAIVFTDFPTYCATSGSSNTANNYNTSTGTIKTKFDTKVDKSQGTENYGKYLTIGSDGNVKLTEKPTHVDNSTTAVNATNATNYIVGGNIESKFATKVDIAQGIENAGNYLTIDANGNVVITPPPTVISLATTADNYSQTGTIKQALDSKVAIAQGTANSGKYLTVNALGNVTLTTLPTTIAHADNADTADYSTNAGTAANYTLSGTIATALAGKVAIAQGSSNSGKILSVNSSGNLVLVNQIPIVNSLISTSTTSALSAYQGYLLNTTKPTLLNGYINASHINPEPGYYSMNPLAPASSKLRANLGTPTLAEMALIDTEFDNKIWFYDPLKFLIELSSDNGTTWTTLSVTDTQLKRMVAANGVSGGFSIPPGNMARVTITNNGNYVYLNALYFYCSTSGNTMSIKLEKKRNDSSSWVTQQGETNKASGWPGHFWLQHGTIPFSQSSTSGHFNTVRLTLIPTWANSNNISFYNMQWWGGYPSGKRTIYSWDEDRNMIFPAAITSNGGATINGDIVGTGQLTANGTNILTALANIQSTLNSISSQISALQNADSTITTNLNTLSDFVNLLSQSVDTDTTSLQVQLNNILSGTTTFLKVKTQSIDLVDSGYVPPTSGGGSGGGAVLF